MPQLVIRIDSYSALGEHSEIDILFERAEEFGLALLRHGNLERADIFHIRGDHHSGGTRVGGSVLRIEDTDADIDAIDCIPFDFFRL